MAHVPWKPVIVGGTDVGDGPDRAVVEPTISEPADAEKNALHTSAPGLAHYSQDNINNGIISTWKYGELIPFQSGSTKSQGRYVTEYRNGRFFEKFWVVD